MSATFRAAAKALADNPSLHAKVISASTPEERAAHFREAGIDVPTHADVNSHMADVDGGTGYTRYGAPDPFGTPPSNVTAAAGAAAT
jgi:hypothetical protein